MASPVPGPTRPAVAPSAACLGVLVVLAANAIYLSGLPAILDPMPSTDGFYIHMAQARLPELWRMDPAWGPLYALWLKAFTAWFADPLALYTANVCALSLAASVALYAYVLLLTRRSCVAIGAALLFLISDLNVPLPDKVGIFALLPLLGGLALGELAATEARRTAIVAAAVLLASYARPELYSAGAGLCLLATWQSAGALRQGDWRAALWAAAAWTVLGAGVGLIGAPGLSAAHDDSRLLVAFREHFAWNWNRWHGDSQGLSETWHAAFGDAPSFSAAWSRNPAAVLHHCLDNLVGAGRFLATRSFDHYPLLAPATQPRLVAGESAGLAVIALGSLLLVLSRPDLRRQLAPYRHVAWPWAALAAASLAGAILIYPIAHYLLPAAVLLMVAGAVCLSILLPAPALPLRWRVSAAVACLAAVPRPFVPANAYAVPGAAFTGGLVVTRPIADAVAALRGLDLPRPMRVLTLTDGIGELLGPGFEEVKAWQKDPRQPLQDFLVQQRIDAIVTLEAGHDSFYLRDPLWVVIQTQPERAGFTRLSLAPGETARIYVRGGGGRD